MSATLAWHGELPLEEPELLGSVPVPGLGEVRLRAQREGNRVVIQALKAELRTLDAGGDAGFVLLLPMAIQ